jgi:hypothetical protein
MTALETTGSGLIAALEQTWADIRRRTPQLPEVVVVTGTGLSSSAVHIDAKWGHFGADHWVEGRPTEEGQGAALDFSAARRKPELFISGECLAEGPRQTLQTMLHKAVHGLAHARGVKDTSWGRQVPQQAGVHRPRRPAGPGQAAGAAAASGDRLLRRAADRADRGRLRRHPRLSGRGHPALPRHPSAAWVCSVAKAKATGRTAKTTTARSHRPARPANGSRSPAAASRPGHSGSHA